MKKLCLILFCLPLAAVAQEKLPDSAPADKGDDREAMSERFDASPMRSGEMQSLFLESPVRLENAEERGGMEAVSDEERYKETDRFLREQQGENIVPLPIIEQKRPEPLVPVAPMRDL